VFTEIPRPLTVRAEFGDEVLVGTLIEFGVTTILDESRNRYGEVELLVARPDGSIVRSHEQGARLELGPPGVFMRRRQA